jgi:hypothetical protein
VQATVCVPGVAGRRDVGGRFMPSDRGRRIAGAIPASRVNQDHLLKLSKDESMAVIGRDRAEVRPIRMQWMEWKQSTGRPGRNMRRCAL